ncbi:MAG TPA: tRNA lysidine(34) synthetase TilS [Marinagarivorans sp.]
MLPTVTLPKNCQRLVVGLSGGVDSVVLLHWLTQQVTAAEQSALPVLALHVNHQLSANADRWQQQMEQLCARWNVPLQVQTVTVTVHGQGLEQAARNARYDAFEAELQSGDVLAVAHHLNDQAETLMLRLMRGTGVLGLSAMAALRPLGQGRLWRPLLGVAKSDILRYAEVHALTWVDDESNRDERFSRNFLRHRILPKLAMHWPQVASKLAQTAEHARETQALLNDYAATDFAAVDHRIERMGTSISLAALQRLSWPRQKHLVRYWLQLLGECPPAAAHLSELSKLLGAQADAQPTLVLGRYSVCRYQQRLYLVPSEAVGRAEPRWQLSEPLTFRTRCQLPDGSLVRIDGFDGELSVRYRQGGERAHPEGRAHSQTLKKLLQEYALEPWLRARVPLIYRGDTLVAVGDLWLQQGAHTLCGLAAGAPLKVQWTLSPHPNNAKLSAI